MTVLASSSWQEHSFKKPLEPSFTVFTEWVSLSVLGVFYAIQAFTIEGKYFDAFVEVSAVFPCQSEDLLRPRFNGTHSCQLALLADAASQRHCQSAFCYCSSPLQMAYWGVIASLTCMPTPQFPALSCQVAAPCSQICDIVLMETHPLLQTCCTNDARGEKLGMMGWED